MPTEILLTTESEEVSIAATRPLPWSSTYILWLSERARTQTGETQPKPANGGFETTDLSTVLMTVTEPPLPLVPWLATYTFWVSGVSASAAGLVPTVISFVTTRFVVEITETTLLFEFAT